MNKADFEEFMELNAKVLELDHEMDQVIKKRDEILISNWQKIKSAFATALNEVYGNTTAIIYISRDESFDWPGIFVEVVFEENAFFSRQYLFSKEGFDYEGSEIKDHKLVARVNQILRGEA